MTEEKERMMYIMGLGIAMGPFVLGSIFYLFMGAVSLDQFAYIFAIIVMIDALAVYILGAHLKQGKKELFIRGVRTGVLLTVLAAFALIIYEITL